MATQSADMMIPMLKRLFPSEMIIDRPPPNAENHSVREEEETTTTPDPPEKSAPEARDEPLSPVDSTLTPPSTTPEPKVKPPADSKPVVSLDKEQKENGTGGRRPRMRGKLKRCLAKRSYFPALAEPPNEQNTNPKTKSKKSSGKSSKRAKKLERDENDLSRENASSTGSSSDASAKNPKKRRYKKKTLDVAVERKSKRQRRLSAKAQQTADAEVEKADDRPPEKPTPPETLRGSDVLLASIKHRKSYQKSKTHAGNVHFRRLLRDNRYAYLSAEANDRLAVAGAIIDLVKYQWTPPGRFMEWNDAAKDYLEASDETVISIICKTYHQPVPITNKPTEKQVKKPAKKPAAEKREKAKPVKKKKGSAKKAAKSPSTPKLPTPPRLPKPPKSSPPTPQFSILLDSVCPTHIDESILGYPLDPQPRTPEESGEFVVKPHVHDVLYGRGTHIVLQPGCVYFRALVRQFKKPYSVAQKSAKQIYARKIIEAVQALDPPGRFLEAGEDGRYADAPDRRIIEKTCQALREKKWRPDGPPVLTPPLVSTPSSSSAASATPRKKSSKIPINSRLSVYWPLDNAHYDATVLDRLKDRVLLRYDGDGVEEWVNLEEHKYKILK